MDSITIVYVAIVAIGIAIYFKIMKKHIHFGFGSKVKHKKSTDPMEEVPSAWVKERSIENPVKPSSPMVHIPIKKTRKFHVPGLRTTKRILAGILFIVNFGISQATLMSHPNTQPLFLLFILNAFIILDYLWKTRGGKQKI